MLLFILWLAGRVAMTGTPGVAGSIIDSAFLVVITGVAFFEVWQAGNRRNFVVVGVVGLYAVFNILFHLERMGQVNTEIAVRGGIATLVMLVSLIGGRIIPNFSRNWLSSLQRPAPIPVTGSFDKISLLVLAVALILWLCAPAEKLTGVFLLFVAVLQMVRFLRWRFWLIRGNALLLVLHVAYAWLPVGALLLGVNLLAPVQELLSGQSAGIHALTAGLMTMMTLSVMTRAILGHTGRPLKAGFLGTMIFILIFLAAFSRVAASFEGLSYQPLLISAAILWSLSFLLFLCRFGVLVFAESKSTE